mmetsp:Transcript_119575/g.187562  ORF Transcript_119575/g.187562 Transcript_119575/m.187562 type:complete len:278 (+) Transcript_119575:1548-2381(+)
MASLRRSQLATSRSLKPTKLENTCSDKARAPAVPNSLWHSLKLVNCFKVPNPRANSGNDSSFKPQLDISSLCKASSCCNPNCNSFAAAGSKRRNPRKHNSRNVGICGNTLTASDDRPAAPKSLLLKSNDSRQVSFAKPPQSVCKESTSMQQFARTRCFMEGVTMSILARDSALAPLSLMWCRFNFSSGKARHSPLGVTRSKPTAFPSSTVEDKLSSLRVSACACNMSDSSLSSASLHKVLLQANDNLRRGSLVSANFSARCAIGPSPYSIMRAEWCN